ncbi:hypothetical protein D0860_07251 [Hortaea werneckii]|uniref:Uncharacterized protein n=1 Tax=Hortaea werneckii TaxID=91943 RepID=A0A3M7GME6_HORWE|nr:hypothetical protein D0860_07251 [Hortaea werneckii]RMZ28379.1 hypothetical protein D0859_07526 [Hortaea werneckii]
MWQGQRRANASKASSNEVKYCSDKCKRRKPSDHPVSFDRRVEDALLALLSGRPTAGHGDLVPPVKAQHKPAKGDARIIVSIPELETAVFGDRTDPEKVYGRRKNRRSRFVRETGEWRSVDMEDPGREVAGVEHADGKGEEEVGGVKVNWNPSDDDDEDEDGDGGAPRGDDREGGGVAKPEETPEMLAKRRAGQKKAEEKELIKHAARRAVVFGLPVDAPAEKFGGKKGKAARAAADTEQPEKVRRKCECLMNGHVVEPSFAKGDWQIRWRED